MLLLPLAINWFMAVSVALLGARRQWTGWLALAGLAASTTASGWLLYVVFTDGPITMVAGGWPEEVGISLRADPLGVVFVLLSNALLSIALFYEDLGAREQRTFPALVLFLAAGLNGLFLTADIFSFYVFFEISMTSSFVLTSYGQDPREVRDTLTFTVVNLLGSIVFLGAIAGLYHVSGRLDMLGVADYLQSVRPGSVILLAALVLAAFGLKLGLFPFHFWLPSVYQGVRPVVAAILSGVLANIGSYGLIRFGADVLAPQLRFAAPALLILGGASILYGALLAVSRTTAQEVLAYSSISQAGYIMVALAIGGPLGFAAAALFAVLNALNKSLLFLAAGLRGKLVGLSFAVGAFSVAGVPPAVGFFGKAAIFQAGVAAQRPALVILIFLGSALSFVYMFRTYQQRYWERSAPGQSVLGQQLLVLALAAAVLALGVWPEPLLAASVRAVIMIPGALP